MPDDRDAGRLSFVSDMIFSFQSLVTWDDPENASNRFGRH
jgi:hypothetical protein